MKKFIATTLVILTVSLQLSAQGPFSTKEYDGGNQPRETYMQGAIPDVDGKLSFTKTFDITGLSKDEAYKRLAQWVSFRFNPGAENSTYGNMNYFKNTEYARVLNADKETGDFEILGNEEMIFTNKALAKDYCIVYYNLILKISDGQVTATMTNITYTYDLGDTTVRYAAEEWITDSVAFNKKGMLAKVNGKFRVKTIDLKDELFKEIESKLK